MSEQAFQIVRIVLEAILSVAFIGQFMYYRAKLRKQNAEATTAEYESGKVGIELLERKLALLNNVIASITQESKAADERAQKERKELNERIDGIRAQLTVAERDLEATKKELATSRRERDEAICVACYRDHCEQRINEVKR